VGSLRRQAWRPADDGENGGVDVEALIKKWSEMNEKNKERNARLDALEREIAELKARPTLKWCGTYVDGQSYQEAQLVTRGGSLWLSTAPTTTMPGEAGSDWRLIVKRGGA